MSKDTNLPKSNNLRKYRKKANHNRNEVAFQLGSTRKEPNVRLLNNLRECRERAGLSLEQVAQKVGVTPATIRKWEQGRSLKNTLYLAAVYADF
jgi:DNA-binding XRE family transcriptional regulator